MDTRRKQIEELKEKKRKKLEELETLEDEISDMISEEANSRLGAWEKKLDALNPALFGADWRLTMMTPDLFFFFFPGFFPTEKKSGTLRIFLK
jgi:hypothetical protein